MTYSLGESPCRSSFGFILILLVFLEFDNDEDEQRVVAFLIGKI